MLLEAAHGLISPLSNTNAWCVFSDLPISRKAMASRSAAGMQPSPKFNRNPTCLKITNIPLIVTRAVAMVVLRTASSLEPMAPSPTPRPEKNPHPHQPPFRLEPGGPPADYPARECLG